MRLFETALALLLSACTDGKPPDAAPAAGSGGAAADGAGAGGADSGSEAADGGADAALDCEADQRAHFAHALPAECAGARTCIDARQRFWLDGEPFFPRGVYNGGFEWARLLDNCPAGAACQATTPADVDAYVQMLADAGFNLIQERSRNVAPLLAAVNASPEVRFAHLLWADPFSADGHDAMIAEIEQAAADPDVAMWFGPDEVDLNYDWHTAAGIRRLLRGASPELDALLGGNYAPPGDPFLPADEPAHDPHRLPFGAALAYGWGLAQGTNVYDVLMPITYPYGPTQPWANRGEWGTARIGELRKEGVPVVPVLQMIGIASMGLVQPTADMIEALIVSSLVHGASGAFYYTLISDQPKTAGRDGWFAADDAEAWARHREMHALEDRLIPVLYSDAEQESGELGDLEWRSFSLAGRRVVAFVNPGPDPVKADLDSVLEPDGRTARGFVDCAPFATGSRTLAGYESLVVELL
jgi:hypothetical protein